MNIEIIRNTLYKAYLEDFYDLCQNLGNPTAEVMGEILKVFLFLFIRFLRYSKKKRKNGKQTILYLFLHSFFVVYPNSELHLSITILF